MPGPRWKEIVARLVLVLVGLGMGLAVLEIGMRLAGEALVQARRQRARAARHARHEVRILCLGESTTDGTEPHGRYPRMLEEILNAQGLEGRVAVVNRGRPGAVSDDILFHLDRDLEQFAPDVVVAMMGINDAGRTHAYGSVIAPGADRWYGSFRVYKLYRLLRDAVARGFAPPPGENPLLLAGSLPLADADPDGVSRLHAEPPDAETAESLRVARELAAAGDHQAAIDALERLRVSRPETEQIQVQLAEVYFGTAMPEKAHEILEYAVARFPRPTAGLVAALARSHLDRGETDRAIERMREVVDSIVDPTDAHEQAHYRSSLAWMYEDDGRIDRAEETWRGIIDLEEGNDVAYQPLIEFLERQDRIPLALHYRAIQERIRDEFVNPRTRRNYRELRHRLEARGIPLIAAQYPARRVEVLRRELDDEEGVIYVDNGFFRELIARDGFGEYFTDHFAGDFGHLTRKGNLLLAENIARVITEEHFGLTFEPLEPDPPTPVSADDRPPAD